MRRNVKINVIFGLVIIAAIMLPGCGTAIVGDAARSSVTSFLTTVFSSAVNAAINPT